MELKLDFLKEFIDTPTQKVKSHHRNYSFGNVRRTGRVRTSQSGVYDSKQFLLGTSRVDSGLESIPSNAKPLKIIHGRKNFLNCKSNDKVFKSPTANDKRFNLALAKVNNYYSKKWMTKHNSRNNDEGYLINFASEFFSILDHKALNKIRGKQLLEHLLSLGIATDSIVLKETLSMIFDCDNIEDLDITLQDFLSLFRPDVVTDLILNQLNESAVSERKKHRVLIQIHKKLKILGETRFSIFSASNKSRRIPKDLNEIKKDEKIITINEHLEVVLMLWKRFFKSGETCFSLITACEAFKFFKVFQDNFECKKYILSVLGQVSFLSFRDFQQLFAKSMLKGAFFNLSKRLFEGHYADKEMSPEFKISSYQRALLMSGVKCPNSNISVEEGQMTVNALEKYQNIIVNPKILKTPNM